LAVRASGAIISLVPFWCQHLSGARAFSGVSTFLVPALFWCQGLSTFLMPEPFLVPEPFWCQYFSGASAFSGVSIFLVPDAVLRRKGLRAVFKGPCGLASRVPTTKEG
jgi:hypothetical protein